MRRRVEAGRVQTPVKESEQRRNGEHRYHHRDPNAPDDVAGFYAVHKGRVEDPGRQVETEPAAL